MKVKLSVIVVVLSIIPDVLTKDLSKVTTLRAVSSVEDNYEHYNVIRGDLDKNGKSLSEDPNETIIQLKLCREIFTSSYFQWYGLEWIDIQNPEVQDSLLFSDKILFHRILKSTDGGYQYNPYLHVDHAFICPVRETHSGQIIPYYVSREYNVNEVLGGFPIAGRLVYTEYFRLQAIAEEPAEGSLLEYNNRLLSEYKYLKYRQFDVQRGESENVDPVCRLTPNFKLRLCVTLFTSERLRHRYKFTPTMENVDTNCRNITVSFRTQFQAHFMLAVQNMPFDKSRTYGERTFVCKGTGIYSNSPVNYYVSQGYEKNTVFTFVESYNNDGRIFVQQYFINVSVADGIGDEEETQVKGNTEEGMKNIEENMENHKIEEDDLGKYQAFAEVQDLVSPEKETPILRASFVNTGIPVL